MKRVIFAASVLILACALVSCGNLTAGKEDEGGSLILYIGGNEARTSSVNLSGSNSVQAEIRVQEDVTSYQLTAYNQASPYNTYTKTIPAGPVIKFDGIPTGTYFFVLSLWDGDVLFANAYKPSDPGDISSEFITITNDAVAEATLSISYIYSIFHNYPGSTQDNPLPYSMGVSADNRVSFPEEMRTASDDEMSYWEDTWFPEGKVVDYWQLIGDNASDTNHYAPDDYVPLSGKKLPLEFEAHWKDAAGGGNNEIPTGFVLVNGGTVTTSTGPNDDNNPFRYAGNTPVSVNAFYLAETETTYERWMEVYLWATSNGYYFESTPSNGWNGSSGFGDTDTTYPVTNITFRDVMVWCNAASEKDGLQPVYCSNGSVVKLYSTIGNINTYETSNNGYRLPTVTEWEYAARGGNPASGNWSYTYVGTNSSPDAYANYMSYAGTLPVASKNSAYGLYDMNGNVWEFVFIPNQASTAYRLARGGASDSEATYLEIGNAYDYNSTLSKTGKSGTVGFRVARNIN